MTQTALPSASADKNLPESCQRLVVAATDGDHVQSTPVARCPRLTRRQLRALNCTYAMDELQQHTSKENAWIAVRGAVYDISDHIMNHPGWNTGGISTVLSILAHLGSDCTEEFEEIHRPYPVAWKQLQAYYIGDLDRSMHRSKAT